VLSFTMSTATEYVSGTEFRAESSICMIAGVAIAKAAPIRTIVAIAGLMARRWRVLNDREDAIRLLGRRKCGLPNSAIV
jgi:hypothetical protein